MSDDHTPIVCEECDTEPTLVRLGPDRDDPDHESFGVECDCKKMDGETPVGSYIDVNSWPAGWDTGEGKIVQTEFQSDYEGLMTVCPFCDPDGDEPGYQPRPYLQSGRCHECGRGFGIRVVWEQG